MVKYDKMIIIGLDGADWRLIDPWIENGYLPTLARLVDEGATGRLWSCIRPESSVAWSSFSTGVNPGKHGVYGFVERTGVGYGYNLANASSVRVRRFWDILGEQGLKAGLLNIPFTYPPSPVNGFVVTGMLTPGPDVPFTYPRALQQRLLNHFGDYIFDIGDSTQDRTKLVDHVRAHTHQQRESALLLLREQPWDCFVVVFTGPDRLQHFLWADLDPKHPLHDPDTAGEFSDALLKHYQALDDAVAKILDSLPASTLVLLMSDHGFNGCARRFYVNRWLQEQGLLVLNRTDNWRSDVARLLSRLGSVRGLRRLKRAIFPDRWSSVSLRSAVFTQAIDWCRTKAYFGLDGGLSINLRGREPEGIVKPGDEYEHLRQELRRELMVIKDPETKCPALSSVFYREELYHGRFVDRAPDLILEPQRDNANPLQNCVLDGSLARSAESTFGSSAPYSANHALDGILVAWGPDVASGAQIQGAHILDLAPTVLAALGLAVPEYMDGRVLSEVFLPGRAPSLQCTSTIEPEMPERPAELFSPEEELAVEARLRDLGYLD